MLNFKIGPVYALRTMATPKGQGEFNNKDVFLKLESTYLNQYGKRFWLFKSIKGCYRECYSELQLEAIPQREATEEEVKRLKKWGYDV